MEVKHWLKKEAKALPIKAEKRVVFKPVEPGGTSRWTLLPHLR
jgi:hypothetical protein